MTFTSENILLIMSILIFCSILISKVGFRFGLPSLLLFLVAGMIFGTDGLGLQFDNVGQAQFIGMVALCIILFTGGLETKFKEIKPILGPGLALSTIGVLLTTAFTVFSAACVKSVSMARCDTGVYPVGMAYSFCKYVSLLFSSYFFM